MEPEKAIQKQAFTRYEIFVIAVLAFLQFTVILDFMVLNPLSAILLDDLNIHTSEFGLVVSAYAFSAGASGLLAAGFADKFDRKKILVFFYIGFLIGTALCAMATNYHFLLGARIFTGLFGGVIGSISFAIISDLFPVHMRGRVMGFVQMAFAASQVLGLPIGLWLANHYGWHSPFWLIVGFGVVVGIFIIQFLKPVTGHLQLKSEKNAFQHLWHTLRKPEYLRGFLATTLLATGGFMLMPFGSAFSIHNLKLTMDELPLLYGVTGVFSIIFGPITGKLSDSIGKYKMFVIGSVIMVVLVGIFTNLGPTPLWLVMVLNVIIFVGISARMISSSALMTSVPLPQDRGAFMSINSSVQQVAGGIASAIAGMIVFQSPSGELQHYPILGIVVIVSVLITIVLMYYLNRQINNKAKSQLINQPVVS
ncbi:MFS transporter [Emticicia sp. CRIBPO]|uniref:MFS transporter n=1 Tax=Emticicia sp. CRIBPO TaxID=2683258 RepID=UPI00141258C1|nr:MFS transporter [Emticicia sp. CRIBPO]NBA84500.1 MFS transporter [Emticicia sp. CRIBPO]